MKRYICLLTLIALLTACREPHDGRPSELTLGYTTLTVGADGGTETLEVGAPGRWYASADAPWLSLNPATGEGCALCTVSVDSTLSDQTRNAKVRFTAEDGREQVLTVIQTGYGPVIRTDSTSLQVVASKRNRNERFFTLSITTNVAFDIDIRFEEGVSPWIVAKDSEVTLDYGARPRTARLRFDWSNNSAPQPRKAEIVFTPKDPSQTLETPASVNITQLAAKRIEDTREGDSLALVVISEALDVYSQLPTGENLQNWDNVRLWEKNDANLPCPEAVGRVRDVQFVLLNLADGETLPPEVKHLKYLESLSFFSNVNSFLKDINLGTDICTLPYLRSLELFSLGLVTLPEELAQLGNTLECLKIGCNNFNEIPAVLTPENFPKLTHLEIQACRRWTTSDLRNRQDSKYERGIGLHFDTGQNDDLKRLLLWDELETLVLSYNYMEGSLPDFSVGQDGVTAWTAQDVADWGGDTLLYLVGKPKILPKAHRLTLNLNFFTGALPDWLLYHPLLLEWDPEQLIFNQMEYGLNSQGVGVRFSNTPNNFEYYFQAFPLYRSKYEIKEEWTDD